MNSKHLSRQGKMDVFHRTCSFHLANSLAAGQPSLGVKTGSKGCGMGSVMIQPPSPPPPLQDPTPPTPPTKVWEAIL